MANILLEVDFGEVLPQHRPGVFVVLDGPDDLVAGLLEAEVEPADPGEERSDFHTPHIPSHSPVNILIWFSSLVAKDASPSGTREKEFSASP